MLRPGRFCRCRLLASVFCCLSGPRLSFVGFRLPFSVAVVGRHCRWLLPVVFFRLSFPFCSYSVLSCPVSFPGSVEHLCNSNPARQRETATGSLRLPLKEGKRNGEGGRVSKRGECARGRSGGTKEFSIVSDCVEVGDTPAPCRRQASLCQREVGRECRFVSVSAFETSETKNGSRKLPIAVERSKTECGDGGSRTLVQTRNPKAFYTFSRPFGPSFSARQAAA